MSDLTVSHHTEDAPLVRRALRRVWTALMHISENSSRMRALRKINDLSDAEIAKMGTTRAQMVQRIFADIYYV